MSDSTLVLKIEGMKLKKIRIRETRIDNPEQWKQLQLTAALGEMESQKWCLTHLHGGREEWREGEMYERVTWKLTLSYVRQIANGNLLYVSGNSNRALDQPRGVKWGGTWEGGSKGRG